MLKDSQSWSTSHQPSRHLRFLFRTITTREEEKRTQRYIDDDSVRIKVFADITRCAREESNWSALERIRLRDLVAMGMITYPIAGIYGGSTRLHFGWNTSISSRPEKYFNIFVRTLDGVPVDEIFQKTKRHIQGSNAPSTTLLVERRTIAVFRKLDTAALIV